MSDTENHNSPYQQHSYRVYVLCLLTFAYCVNFIDRQVLAILMPEIKADMDLSDTQLGFLSGIAFALLYSTVGIPIAKLADKKNRSLILSVAIAIWSAMTALCGLAQNFVHLIAARIGVGIGEAGGTPPSHSIIADIFPEKSRATALSIYSLGIPLGILIGLMLGGWLGENFDWRVAFIVVGLPGILLAIVVKLTLKEPERNKAYLAFQEKNQISIRETVAWLFSFKSFRHFALGATLISFASYGLSQWAPSFLLRTYDVSLSYAGFYLALVFGIGGGLGTFMGGYVSDRLSKGADKRWYLWVPGFSALFFVPFSFLFFSADTVELSLLYMTFPVILSVTFIGPIHALTQAVAGPNRRAMASGIMLLLINLFGLGLGPQVIGIVSDLFVPRFGDSSLKYSILVVSCVAAAWSCLHLLLASKYLNSDLNDIASINSDE